jgi:hypothetical protein
VLSAWFFTSGSPVGNLSYKHRSLCLLLSVCPVHAQCADRRYDAFGIAVTNPEKIVEVALLYSYGFGVVLHSEMTLYMAQEISPIAWVYQLYALETLPKGES